MSSTPDITTNPRSRTLYEPWGEVRYQSGALPTDYTFTGQYSHTDDFGLMFYVARWYDPGLGRFAQADSIVPGAGNPMAWDRYAYVNNSPVNYNDPSGHIACSPHRPCEPTTPYIPPPITPATPAATPTPTPNIAATVTSSMATYQAEHCTGTTFMSCDTATPTPWSPVPTPTPDLPNTWEVLRGAADPFTISPDAFTGASTSPQHLVEQAAISLEAINFPGSQYILKAAPVVPLVATGYAFAYDNVTNSGDYNVEVGPLTPTQVTITILTILTIMPVLPPFP